MGNRRCRWKEGDSNETKTPTRCASAQQATSWIQAGTTQRSAEISKVWKRSGSEGARICAQEERAARRNDGRHENMLHWSRICGRTHHGCHRLQVSGYQGDRCGHQQGENRRLEQVRSKTSQNALFSLRSPTILTSRFLIPAVTSCQSSNQDWTKWSRHAKIKTSSLARMFTST